MNFEEYLVSKKIDSSLFKRIEKDLWLHFNDIFKEMHTKSFTIQKLNLINGIRRKYPLSNVEQKETPKPKLNRPVIRPKKPQ